MNTNGDGDDGDAAVGDGNDAQSSLDTDGSEDRCPSASSPLRSLPGVRFLRVLVSTNVESLIRLHGVKVFDLTVRLTHWTVGMRPYQWSPKLLSLDYLVGFLPGARIIVIKVSMAFNQHIFVQKL
jgi:hypothetical protein